MQKTDCEKAQISKLSTYMTILIARRRLLLVQLSAEALRGLIEWYGDDAIP